MPKAGTVIFGGVGALRVAPVVAAAAVTAASSGADVAEAWSVGRPAVLLCVVARSVARTRVVVVVSGVLAVMAEVAARAIRAVVG